jgi:hypothetical protein
MDDYFLVDFAEGKSPLIFKPTLHGSEEKSTLSATALPVRLAGGWC